MASLLTLMVLVAVLVQCCLGQFFPVENLNAADLVGNYFNNHGDNGSISCTGNGQYTFKFLGAVLKNMVQEGSSGKFTNGDDDLALVYKFVPQTEAAIYFNGPTMGFQTVDMLFSGPFTFNFKIILE